MSSAALPLSRAPVVKRRAKSITSLLAWLFPASQRLSLAEPLPEGEHFYHGVVWDRIANQNGYVDAMEREDGSVMMFPSDDWYTMPDWHAIAKRYS